MSETENGAQLMTVTEATKYLGLSRGTFEKLLYEGALPAINLRSPQSRRNNWRIRKADLEAFLKSRQIRPVAA